MKIFNRLSKFLSVIFIASLLHIFVLPFQSVYIIGKDASYNYVPITYKEGTDINSFSQAEITAHGVKSLLTVNIIMGDHSLTIKELLTFKLHIRRDDNEKLIQTIFALEKMNPSFQNFGIFNFKKYNLEKYNKRDFKIINIYVSILR